VPFIAGEHRTQVKEIDMSARRKAGFTLVELLIVIGVIALLISILLPALGRAREAANTIKCASNLHSIGTGIALYAAQYKGALPASNFYSGLQIGGGTQLPATPIAGYVHWSSYLYAGGKHSDPNDPVFRQLTGWDMFQCPSLPNGGLPPANTFPGNNEAGVQNEAGADVVDLQAPRLAYMLNEALTPRSIFVAGFRSAIRPYHFVRMGSVRHNAETILATEFWGTQSTMLAASNVTSSTPVSNTRRPVSGISASLSGLPSPDKAYLLPLTSSYGWATVNKLTPAPEASFAATAPGSVPAPDTTLDFIGRNHGSRKLGSVAGDTRSGWDLRKSNFLYVDGHVETKHVSETVYPKSQWGDQFYSLTP
jgi:prepilin-type N-terminal cleavage/methylation domain-containing protein/prepilin-type processing-associated H-X9-DG protein